jgi:pyridoxine 5-phosphate synthase
VTVLSVNVNKIALLRNSRGRDFPCVVGFSEQLIDLGVKGITVHPRPDERHVTRRDVYALSEMLRDKPQVEFNIEVCPDQCTLVPDSPGQLTSDHGWNIPENQFVLQQVLSELREGGVRSSLFLDPDSEMVGHVTSVAADRIELYTENFANHYAGPQQEAVFERYRAAAQRAGQLGIGINAGHDLDLQNLTKFLQIPNILEVSIGHALIVESLQLGVAEVIKRYLTIVDAS